MHMSRMSKFWENLLHGESSLKAEVRPKLKKKLVLHDKKSIKKSLRRKKTRFMKSFWKIIHMKTNTTTKVIKTFLNQTDLRETTIFTNSMNVKKMWKNHGKIWNRS